MRGRCSSSLLSATGQGDILLGITLGANDIGKHAPRIRLMGQRRPRSFLKGSNLDVGDDDDRRGLLSSRQSGSPCRLILIRNIFLPASADEDMQAESFVSWSQSRPASCSPVF